MRSPYILCSAALLTACAVAQAPSGTMQGWVTAEDGAPVAGAVVYYSRITRLVGPAARARHQKIVDGPSSAAEEYYRRYDTNKDY